MEILLFIKLFALPVLSVLVTFINAQSRQQEQSQQAPSPHKPSGKISHSYRTDPKNRALQADLLALLKNDVPTAKRLLGYQRRLNPGKSDNWYLEKVICDLERDRR
ncbi:MAG: hypothetical protein V7K67_16995 [Nostoc sp.]